MPVVCPNCDAIPAPTAAAGAACAVCKMSLVTVKESEDLVGQTIDGRFEIVARLGQGGMGTVYRATQKSIGREVALKVIDRRFEDDVVAVKRFLREAKLASALVHPNTVGVIEFGQSPEGRLYLAMELVRGTTLLSLAKDGHGLPLARIARIGVQLCDALEAAHALHIVHRDLKLENVMLLDGPRDHIKVLDFGLARSLVDLDSRATASGLIAGTPRYLPPEVALGGADAAPAQDMYALGVLLGELSTGSPLWEAPTLEALFTEKMHGAPKLDGTPAPLRTLIDQLLSTAPESRPTAAAAREALLAIGAPTRQSPVGLEPTREVAVAPPPAVAPSADRAPLTSSAFAPPEPHGDPLKLEDEWQHEKAAKIAAALQPPPKRPTKLLGIIIAVAMVAIVTTVVIIIGTSSSDDAPKSKRASRQIPATANTVSIEVRTKPRGEVTFDGHKAGNAPVTLHMPKGTHSVEIAAVLAGHTISKTIIPDHDQTIDLTYP